MKSRWQIAVMLVLLVTIMGAGDVLRAQDSAEAEEESTENAQDTGRKGVLYAEFASWVAQPVGLEYTPSTRVDPVEPIFSNLIHARHGTEPRDRVRVGFEFNGNAGEFVVTWFSHEDEVLLGESTPAVFQYGELLSTPYFAGVNDDGLADAFTASTDTKLRDLRMDYYRPAFENPKASAKWFVGVRRVFHRRTQEATYYSLVPGLPPLLPPVVSSPRDDLDPNPDTAFMQSEFSGRGAEAGIDFKVPLWKDRFTLEAGVLAAVLRGTVDTSYLSQTSFYADVDTLGNVVEILAAPYDEFTERIEGGTEYRVKNIRQLSFPIGLRAEGLSVNAEVLETYLGFRWKAWRGLQVIGGFRNARYNDVGLDMRPDDVTVSANGSFNFSSAERVSRSASYEGLYLGVAYSY